MQIPIFAQLAADFTTTDGKLGGCAPLAISFKNTTKGASANATYKWDLGNNNVSTLQHPGSVYTAEKTYQVTLTVTDGAATSSKTIAVTVYKKPIVNFVVENGFGCAPLTTTFKSTSTAGDGIISNYFWDFGDGIVAQDSSFSTIQHTYNFAKKAEIDLVVTNSFGCQNTIQKDNLVEIKNKAIANFTVNNTSLCNTQQKAQFNNTSNGPGNLIYSWSFGDGGVSTDKSPSYQYTQKGQFSVRLIVNSDFGLGCNHEITQNNLIKVADFSTDITVPSLICNGSSANFSAINIPTPTATQWAFSDNNFATASTNSSVSKTFTAAGVFTVRLINTYGICRDTVVKSLTVQAAPSLKGFLVSNTAICSAPAIMYFEDTTVSATQWNWNFNMAVSGATGNTKSPAYKYMQEGSYTVGLTVTNANGCKASTTKTIDIRKTAVNIQLVQSTSVNGLSGCPGFSISLAATPATFIKQYQWQFSDGFSTNLPQATHVFDSVGIHRVKLLYTSNSGCKDSVQFNSAIQVFQKPKANFSVSKSVVCGNNAVVFTNTSTPISTRWFWDYGDKNTAALSASNHTVSHKYLDSGFFNVRLVAVNGVCADTIDKLQAVKVLPPFTTIAGISNNCTSRGDVLFTFTTRGGNKFEWDFGDGTKETIDGTPKPIRHTYSKSGNYTVKLTAYSDECTVEDGGVAQVLLKKEPVLTARKTIVCLNDSLNVTLANLDVNPTNLGYNIVKIEDANGNLFAATNRPTAAKWTNVYIGNLSSISKGNHSIRFIIQSNQFNCFDTSNFINFKTTGPIANFNIQTVTACYKEAVKFSDVSIADTNAPIKKWEWFFGDGKTNVQTEKAAFQFQYNTPGLYNPTLKVTDTNGCFTINSTKYKSFVVKGPKAAFVYAPTAITPNVPVTFTNTSNTYGNTNTQFAWQFSVGKFNSNSNTTVVRTYNNSVVRDTVTLIVKDATSSCADTTKQVVVLKRMDLDFTFTAEYISKNACPPLLANFTAKTTNVNAIAWKFGDNSTASNIATPSHTYHKPGIYKITMYGFGNNNVVDSITKEIEIKGPFATLFADSYLNCTPANLTLSATAKNATSFIWDFGDGTLSNISTDTFASHVYNVAGVYKPSLIMKDSAGCSSIFEMNSVILMDSINTKGKIDAVSKTLCNNGNILFTGNVNSIGNQKLGLNHAYSWLFANGMLIDSSNMQSPLVQFSSIGKHPIALEMKTQGGCKATFVDTIVVKPSAKPSIVGVKNVCIDEALQLSGISSQKQDITWNWTFENGNRSNLQQPTAQIFTNTKSLNRIQLITSLNGCFDTVSAQIQVFEKPTVQLTPKNAKICLGDSIKLTAQNGNKYEWIQSKLTTPNNVFYVAPTISTSYQVKVTNKNGCEAVDTAFIEVVQPFKLQTINSLEACVGNTIQLQAKGATTYKWINTDNSLSSNTSATPTAIAKMNTQFKVVGFDADGCFTDTATTNILVHPLPTVQLESDIVLGTGAFTTLKPNYSADVQRVNWFPNQYLNAANSFTPTVTPKSNITYVVTATSKYGCEAKDSVLINLQCIQDNLYLPTGFTPNKNGLNDVFYPLGKGINVVKHFAVYNRTGQVLFEKSNFQLNDKSSGWNGKFQGYDQPTGVYIYAIEVECDTKEIFSKKGTITLIR